MTIIINNVYAFQYPTKNRCTILVQPSFAKLVLLPIREAYEWKPKLTSSIVDFCLFKTCFQFVKRMNGNVSHQYKRALVLGSCFQFVKRMNGNSTISVTPSVIVSKCLLPIREAYEWKLVVICTSCTDSFLILLASNS